MLKNRNEVLGHGLGLVTLYLSTTLTLDCVSDVGSGTGTNLKVGEGTGPERKWGAPIRRKAPEKKLFLGRVPPLFGSKSTNYSLWYTLVAACYEITSVLFFLFDTL